MVCRLVKYFPKQVQSENTNPGKWHRIVILQLIDEKLKKNDLRLQKILLSIWILQWIMISANWKMILQLKVVCSPERILPYLSKMSSLLLLWIHPHNLSFKFVSNLSDLCVIFYVPISMYLQDCLLNFWTSQIWKAPI